MLVHAESLVSILAQRPRAPAELETGREWRAMRAQMAFPND